MPETIAVLSAAPVALPLTLSDDEGGTCTLLLAAAHGGVPSRTAGVDAAFYHAWVDANPDHPAVVNDLLAEVADDEAVPASDEEGAVAFETLTTRLAQIESEATDAAARITVLEAERDAALTARDSAVSERDAAIAERDALVAERDAAISDVERLTGELQAARMAIETASEPTAPSAPVEEAPVGTDAPKARKRTAAK